MTKPVDSQKLEFSMRVDPVEVELPMGVTLKRSRIMSMSFPKEMLLDCVNSEEGSHVTIGFPSNLMVFTDTTPEHLAAGTEVNEPSAVEGMN